MQLQLAEAFRIANEAKWSATHDGRRFIYDDVHNAYLAELDTIDRKDVERLLDSTFYIDWSQMIRMARSSVARFLDDVGGEPYYILLSWKFGSEDLVIAKIWDLLEASNLIGFIDYDDPWIYEQNANVLIIDDAIYSGQNMTDQIHNLVTSNEDVEIDIYIVVSVSASNGIGMIRVEVDMLSGRRYELRKLCPKSFDSDTPIYNVNLRGIYTTLLEGVPTFSDDFRNRFGAQCVLQVPLYFDHKVAGLFSSYPQIYLDGHVSDGEDFGSLLPYPPDTDLKQRVYDKFFVLTSRPGPRERGE